MQDDAPAEDEELTLEDSDFLSIVREQRRQSLGFGFDNDDELASAREKALNYLKGEMSDVTSMPNRSQAVSSDVSDAIETALPDLIEVFIGGDDVATFLCDGPEDEDQAKLETEFVTQVIFDQNPGFLLFYSIIKDALTCKLGVAKSWWEDGEEVSEDKLTGLDPALQSQIEAAAAEGGAEVADPVVGEDGQLSLTLRRTIDTGCQRNMAVPPEDFTFARDTVSLRDTVYCAMRSRPRAQALIDQGYDSDLVDTLPDYASRDDATDLARDTAGETSLRSTSFANRPLRPVEIVEHYIRVDADGDGKTELWRVVTGGGETVFLEKERVPSIPFAVITPYITPHRLLGRSLADLLIEVQRIKTALLRMLLDSGYFALNQRMEIADSLSNEWTIGDMMRNEPNLPVRVKQPGAVRALSSGGLSFDVTGALEYISTVSEQRTGIVRNAQGLNPDTLHDTADGARQLIAAAQKRIRLIARVFAETGVKDLFLNVHEILRLRGREVTANLSGKWAQVDPSQWKPRKGMRVEIGVGSGGREHDIMAGNALNGMLAQAVQAQGGITGPLTNPEAISAAARRQTERLGFKNAEQYWPDPKAFAAQQAQQPPQPDPKVLEAQAKAQLAQQQAQQDHQLAMTKATADAQLRQQESNARAQQAATDADRQHALKVQTTQAELDLKRGQLEAELALKREQMQAEAQLKLVGIRVGAQASTSIGSEVQPGGEPG